MGEAGDSGRRRRRNGTQHVTVSDVAELANVSTQTVSRVINDRPEVADATRRAVQDAIRELDYRPSAAARSLASRRSSAIGVAVAGLQYVGTAQTLSGIVGSSSQAGYSVLLNEANDVEASDHARVFRSLLGRQVDGLIFCGPEIGDNVGQIEFEHGSTGIPLVFAHSSPSPERQCVTIDNTGGATRAVDHLVERGCTRIAHISGPLDWSEAQQRRDGWLAGLRRHRLYECESLHVGGDWSPRSGARCLEDLLTIDPHIDGVVVANDQMALGVLSKAQDKGIAVPDALRVVGFDDIAEAEMFTPPLTTIRQPLRDAGVRAVDVLLALIAGRSTDDLRTHLTTELVVRQSSG